jgi:dipeptidyl aminopeptidase/acylaminoacyl peptidase
VQSQFRITNYEKNKKKELQKRSVINWADELDKNASLLILCGTEDEQVNPNQADLIAKKLKEINYNFKLEKVKTDHKFSNKQATLNRLVINWFKENL